MSENLTVSQLAKELNVSRQKIYRFIDKQENNYIHQYIYTNSKKIKMINAEGVRYIKENIYRTADGQNSDKIRTREKTFKKNVYSDFESVSKKEFRTVDGQGSDSGRTDFLIKQLEQKDIQIDTLQKIIDKNQNLLDQQQRLALQDKKLLEEYKEEINELKSLMIPVREDENDPIAQQSKDTDNIKEDPQKKNKKWWHFGRNVE